MMTYALRHFGWIAPALLIAALGACSREQVTDLGTAPGNGGYAVIVPPGETRTEFDSHLGKFAWSEGDRIAIHLSDGTFYETSVHAETGAFLCSTTATKKRDAYAIYPASVRDDGNFGYPTLNVVLQAEYDISDNLASDFSPVPMIAMNREGEDDLYFRHVGGLLRITCNNVPAGTQKIAVTLDHSVAGTFSVSGAETENPVISRGGSASTVGFIVAAEGLSDTMDGIVLNLPVPVGPVAWVRIDALDASGNVVSSQTRNFSFSILRGHGKKILFDAPRTGGGDNGTPLTLEALAAGYIYVTNPFKKEIIYTLDGNTSALYRHPMTESETSFSIPVLAGQTVQFYGRNTTLAGDSVSMDAGNYPNIRTFHGNDEMNGCPVYMYGNVMSLVQPSTVSDDAITDPASFSSLTELSDPFTFAGLFSEGVEECVDPVKDEWITRPPAQSYIHNHPTEDILLPATTLTMGCYAYMFAFDGVSRVPALPALTVPQYAYAMMYRGCPGIVSVPESLLPAMTLSEGCYQSMFYACSGLKNTPDLPATVTADNCYQAMFMYCISLEDGPSAFPALSLADWSCASLFSECTSLKSIPAEIAATTVGEGACFAMFESCESLLRAPAIHAVNLGRNCFESMFSRSGIITAPALPATELAPGCYEDMFEYCRSLETAPDLPAAVLASSCYRRMFNGCNNLTSVKCLATDISADDCTYEWLQNVSETGIFTKAAGVDAWTRDESGIPSGWTVMEE